MTLETVQRSLNVIHREINAFVVEPRKNEEEYFVKVPPFVGFVLFSVVES